MTDFPATRNSLIAQIKSTGNQQAWDEFVDLYRPVIYRMARRRGLQDVDAQDLVQSVLVRVAQAIPRWEKTSPDVRFRHWLGRVARNAILSALLRQPQDRAAGGSAAFELLADVAEAHPDLHEELAREALREQYLRAAAIVRADVDAATWQAFELTMIHGHSCEAAAKMTRKSVGSIYAARSRVMRRLRDQIRLMQDQG